MAVCKSHLISILWLWTLSICTSSVFVCSYIWYTRLCILSLQYSMKYIWPSKFSAPFFLLTCYHEIVSAWRLIFNKKSLPFFLYTLFTSLKSKAPPGKIMAFSQSPPHGLKKIRSTNFEFGQNGQFIKKKKNSNHFLKLMLKLVSLVPCKRHIKKYFFSSF